MRLVQMYHNRWVVSSRKEKSKSVIHGKNNTLFLRYVNNDFFAGEAAKSGLVEVDKAYKNIPTLLKAVRLLHRSIGTPFYTVWLADWKDKLSQYQTIIIDDAALSNTLVNYIHRKFPDTRIIGWYWNPILGSYDSKLINNAGCEIWTFDKNDSAKYGFKYNTQYYFNDVDLMKSKITTDIMFAGKDKGRYATIKSLEAHFKKLGLKSELYIMPTGSLGERTDPNKYSAYLSYASILEIISHSRAILDIVADSQSGLTIRAMESIFFEKKLVTNLSDIKYYDFYTPQNIFILGEDNMKKLPLFLNKPYQKVSKDIVLGYDFTNWLNRFSE
jgi:hypothetical protein